MTRNIYLYDAEEADFTTLGYGPIAAIDAVFAETGNGDSSLTATVAFDEKGIWTFIQPEMILAAYVPVRMTPELDGGKIVTGVEKWKVKDTASKTQRVMYTTKNGNEKKDKIPKGTSVTVVKKPTDAKRYKIKASKYGTGWMDKDALEYEVAVTLPNDPSGIETAETPWIISKQLFRIYNYVRNETSITVEARHITYDLLGHATQYYEKGAAEAQTALAAILENTETAHDFSIQSNITGTRTGVDWRYINPISALLDPEKGFIARWGGYLIRDNYELTIMAEVATNRGIEITYGKNLQGVEVQVDYSNVATAVLPLGRTESGGYLRLTDDGSADIIRIEGAESAIERLYVLDCASDATVSDSVGIGLARDRMRKAAEDFIANGPQIPSISMSVDFLQLGDTDEYAEFRDLERVYLYDWVRVRMARRGIDSLMQVTSIEYDPIRQRFIKAYLGDGIVSLNTIQLSSFQVPGGLNGYKILPGTIGGGHLTDDAINSRHIQADSITARNIQAGSITAGKIAAGAITAGKIDANAITAGNIQAGAITADKIDAGAITADKIASKTITADKLMAGLITANSGLIADGAILAAQIGSLNADVIDAGTLKAERLLIRGKDGLLYKINADAAGLSKEELSEEQYENLINGTVIVAKSITADQIKAGTITALEINVPDLFASKATIEALNAADISGNRYLQLYVANQAAAAPGTSRNFLLGTKDDTTMTGTGGDNQSMLMYATAPDFKIMRPEVGGYMTLSFDWATSGATGSFTPQWDGGSVWRIGTSGAVSLTGGAKSGRFEHTFQMSQTEFAAPLTGVRIRMDGVSGSVTFSNMKLEKGDRATDWIPAVEDPAYQLMAGSTVLITEDEVKISTPTFTVDVPTTEGSDVQVNEKGFSAPVITSPTVAKAREGGIYIVGANGDFANIAEAFGNIGDRVIEDDIVLKIAGSSDAGGVLRGVRGSGRVLITPINMVNAAQTAAWSPSGVTISQISATDGNKGVVLQATSAGTYRQAWYRVGHVGALGLRGRKLTLRCTMYSASASDPAMQQRIEVYAGDKYLSGIVRSTSNLTTRETKTVTFTIPADTGSWSELLLKCYISTSSSVTATAKGYFEDIRLEVGESINSLNTGISGVTTKIVCEGCSAAIHLHGLTFTGKLEGQYSALYANRCTFLGSNGFMLWGGYGAVYNCYGACSSTAVMAAGGAAIEINGTAPSGTRKGLIDDGDASTGTPPAGDSPVVVNTITLNAQSTGTYSGSAWWSDAAIRQGYTQANGRMRGGIWFDLTEVQGKTIKAATLRLRRVEGYGKGGNVDVKIFATDSGALSGQPTTTGTAVTGKMAPGQVKSFNVASLMGHKGFVLYADDTTVQSGRTYSDNYARFTGTGGGEATIPQLVVTYQ